MMPHQPGDAGQPPQGGQPQQGGQLDTEQLYELTGRKVDLLRDPIGSDALMASVVAEEVLKGFCWAGGLGWRKYDRDLGNWPPVPDEKVIEQVRRWMLARYAACLKQATEEAQRGKDSDYYEKLATAWRKSATAFRIFAVTKLARGRCLVEPGRFDTHPDLLNTPDGVVDLRTGERHEHDPKLLFTQVTGVRYVPGAKHPDVEKALEAIPDDTRDYAQLRYGQGITGYKPPDDVIDVQHGHGSNGKTTILAAIKNALGDYAAVLPAKLLYMNPGTHSTELMTLRGVRFGIIEELPEERHLSVAAIKIASAPQITARLVHKDNVTFGNTCALFISTNPLPQVRETDHGTWRRLEGSVPFPYTFRKPHEPLRDGNDRRGDGTLRERVIADRGERAEAMLAWLVKGAQRWYAGELTAEAAAAVAAAPDAGAGAICDEPGAWKRPPRTMGEPPRRVREHVAAWRESCDVLYAYITDRLVFDPGSHVIAEDLLRTFNSWLRGRGSHEWGMELFEARFGSHSEAREHGVTKIRPRAGREPGLSRPPVTAGVVHEPPKQRYTAWRGVRFGLSEDEETAGGSGWSDLKVNPLRESPTMEFTFTPDHPDQRSFSGHDFGALWALADHSVDTSGWSDADWEAFERETGYGVPG